MEMQEKMKYDKHEETINTAGVFSSTCLGGAVTAFGVIDGPGSLKSNRRSLLHDTFMGGGGD